MLRLREFAGVALAVFVVVCGVVFWKAGAPDPSPFLQRPIALAATGPLTLEQGSLDLTPPRLRLADGPPLPANAIAAAQLPPKPITLDPAIESEMAEAVAGRLAARVPGTLTPYFDLYFYVSKAAAGPWAQRMFVFRKNADGTLAFEESFPVSTGRERAEKYFTVTPTGLFQLDRTRFIPMARSAKWNDALMPWAMFLNYSYRTQMTGVALHAAIGRRELADLGSRASGGCVRLPLDKAKRLFHRIQQTMGGQVPVFSFDDARGTTSVTGEMVRDGAGNVMVADGYRVLIVIDAYPGRASGNLKSS